MGTQARHIASAPDACRSVDAARLGWLVAHGLVLVPAFGYAATGIAVLAANYWSTEQGGHGPLILASGAWLLWYKAQGLAHPPTQRRDLIAAAGIIGFGVLSILAAMLVKQFIQTGATYGALLFLLYRYIGSVGLRRLWAPLAYLAFLIPPPENVIVPLTHALKGQVANASVHLLFLCGYPVAKDGPELFIGPYELVVAAACSGLNSIVSLLALGLFYTYLVRPHDWRYAIILSFLIVPIAVIANVARVIAIMLMTFHFGEEAGQGLIHDALGLFLFLVAMLLLAGTDALLYPLWRGRAVPAVSVAL